MPHPPEDQASPRGDITRWLEAHRAGDGSAVEHLLPLVHSELRRMAADHFQNQPADHTWQPTVLVHEAYLKLFDGGDLQVGSRAHFLAIAGRAMRQLLVDHARGRSRAKRGGAARKITLATNIGASTEEFGVDFERLHQALEKLSTLHARQAEIVEHRFFGGMEIREVADVLGISTATVERDWRAARAWLGVHLQSD